MPLHPLFSPIEKSQTNNSKGFKILQVQGVTICTPLATKVKQWSVKCEP